MKTRAEVIDALDTAANLFGWRITRKYYASTGTIYRDYFQQKAGKVLTVRIADHHPFMGKTPPGVFTIRFDCRNL